mmetsp:Transcript_18786/g.33014  ORF Transcript_18786/g.33014 Transcript_18786/m.33014 type:complete len:222 (+) Transcript_18786:224-889(+)
MMKSPVSSAAPTIHSPASSAAPATALPTSSAASTMASPASVATSPSSAIVASHPSSAMCSPRTAPATARPPTATTPAAPAATLAPVLQPFFVGAATGVASGAEGSRGGAEGSRDGVEGPESWPREGVGTASGEAEAMRGTGTNIAAPTLAPAGTFTEMKCPLAFGCGTWSILPGDPGGTFMQMVGPDSIIGFSGCLNLCGGRISRNLPVCAFICFISLKST